MLCRQGQMWVLASLVCLAHIFGMCVMTGRMSVCCPWYVQVMSQRLVVCVKLYTILFVYDQIASVKARQRWVIKLYSCLRHNVFFISNTHTHTQSPSPVSLSFLLLSLLPFPCPLPLSTHPTPLFFPFLLSPLSLPLSLSSLSLSLSPPPPSSGCFHVKGTFCFI